MSIDYSVSDIESGVFSSSAKFDNINVENGQNIDLFFQSLGNHTITYFSTDRAGNNEPKKTTTFTIDTIPPEAVIEFDPATKDIKFTGADVTQVTVEDNDDTITLTDQAGNTTEITLKDKNRKRKMKAEIKEIKYNNIPADITKNRMQFSWNLDKKTQDLKTLRQHIKLKNNYNITATYNTNQTKISGKDETGKIKQTLDGLKLVKVITDKGELWWGY